MKEKILLAILLILASCGLYAQQPNYKVVFDMSTRDSVSQQAVLREVNGIRKGNPAAMLEVVIYGQALDMVTKNQSKYATDIARLLADKKTSFKVCAATMKRFNVNQDQLLPGVKVVPDGIYEIITKQQQGWGYIKVAH